MWRRRRTRAKRQTVALACPEPNPRLEVTSTEVNLFVWTEYIPQHTIDCFEEVYGVTVNKDEYSSNEEMYAKLSAGGANYDLVQPTDYIVALMIRQGLLQALDKGKLPIFDNFDPNYLNLSFRPGKPVHAALPGWHRRHRRQHRRRRDIAAILC